jgi:hypothetical protein
MKLRLSYLLRRAIGFDHAFKPRVFVAPAISRSNVVTQSAPAILALARWMESRD